MNLPMISLMAWRRGCRSLSGHGRVGRRRRGESDEQRMVGHYWLGILTWLLTNSNRRSRARFGKWNRLPETSTLERSGAQMVRSKPAGDRHRRISLGPHNSWLMPRTPANRQNARFSSITRTQTVCKRFCLNLMLSLVRPFVVISSRAEQRDAKRNVGSQGSLPAKRPEI